MTPKNKNLHMALALLFICRVGKSKAPLAQANGARYQERVKWQFALSQPPLQIGNNIFDILQSYGQAHESICDSLRQTRLAREHHM